MHGFCVRCRGRGWCNKPCEILQKFKDKAPKVKMHFSGSSPPEIFVGRISYPHVFSGILSPTQKGETGILASPEEWVENNLDIESILEMRGQLIYGRGRSHIKASNQLKKVTQELALASKPVSTEVFLKKKPNISFTPSKVFSIMTNPAPLKSVRLEDNPIVPKKVDYLTGDYDVKANTALQELYKTKILTSHLQKLLAAGLLGVKASRKMVPTRWSITAVDDTLGKALLDNIRYYPEINQIQLFHTYYNGNHFEVLLLPDKWAFEVIEVSLPGNAWAESNVGLGKSYFMNDYEGFFKRKSYAKNVTGGYYADRLGVLEYLERIKRQATCLVFHEERPEYYAPLGVGIIRESVRRAMKTKPEEPETREDALRIMAERLKVSIDEYKKRSWILENFGKQKRLGEWF
jgi:DNA repair protein NreA